MKLKTVASFIAGGHFNQEKSMIIRQLAVCKVPSQHKDVGPKFLNFHFSTRTTNKIRLNFFIHTVNQVAIDVKRLDTF